MAWGWDFQLFSMNPMGRGGSQGKDIEEGKCESKKVT